MTIKESSEARSSRDETRGEGERRRDKIGEALVLRGRFQNIYDRMRKPTAEQIE